MEEKKMDVLSEIRVDEFEFMVTRTEIQVGACMLWVRERRGADITFEALGWFAGYDRRSILDFITRYTTSARMRSEVERRRFRHWVDSLDTGRVRNLDRMSAWKKETSYRAMFKLKAHYTRAELDSRRKILARRFHPDMGGDHRAMQFINRAYDELAQRAA